MQEFGNVPLTVMSELLVPHVGAVVFVPPLANGSAAVKDADAAESAPPNVPAPDRFR